MNLLPTIIVKKGSEQTQIRLFSSGYCVANERHIHPAAAARAIPFLATWALIEHPRLGKIIFDTGYSQRFFEATSTWPNRLYRWATPVKFNSGESCLERLEQNGIAINDVRHLVISHFHGDHIGGLLDFNTIPVWCTQAALDFVGRRSNRNGVFKGILKPLVPRDLGQRAMHPDRHLPEIMLGPFRCWQWEDDLIFVDLPGHCRGQMGLLIKNSNWGDLLLCADAVWSSRAYREQIHPQRIVSLFVDDYGKLIQTIDHLHCFHLDYPEILILPTHCPETARLVNN